MEVHSARRPRYSTGPGMTSTTISVPSFRVWRVSYSPPAPCSASRRRARSSAGSRQSRSTGAPTSSARGNPYISQAWWFASTTTSSLGSTMRMASRAFSNSARYSRSLRRSSSSAGLRCRIRPSSAQASETASTVAGSGRPSTSEKNSSSAKRLVPRKTRKATVARVPVAACPFSAASGTAVHSGLPWASTRAISETSGESRRACASAR